MITNSSFSHQSALTKSTTTIILAQKHLVNYPKFLEAPAMQRFEMSEQLKLDGNKIIFIIHLKRHRPKYVGGSSNGWAEA